MDLLAQIVFEQVRRGPVGPMRPSPGGPSGGDVAGAAGAMFGFFCCFGVTMLLFTVPVFIGLWKIFEKAGEPGWAALVPVYNLMVLGRISGKGEMYGLLSLIPMVGIIFNILMWVEICNRFGVGGGYVIGILLLSPVFIPMLGFGSARYRAVKQPARYDDDFDDYGEDDDRPRRRREDYY
ncbi:MAG TPA: DUF5684 domain-containing protein [Gemmataceae bacterium]|jgi:hypothetical protein|nr:DUF5684 domain-containing protein [Gemmataceae bacterium]